MCPWCLVSPVPRVSGGLSLLLLPMVCIHCALMPVSYTAVTRNFLAGASLASRVVRACNVHSPLSLTECRYHCVGP